MQAKLLALALSLGLTFSVVPTANAQEELLNLEPAIATSQAQEEALTSRVEAATKASRAARLLQVRAIKLVDAAAALKGVRYKWAGSSPKSGFDCSGFTAYVYNKVGIELPRSSGAIRKVAEKINKSELKTGDLVFWHNKSGRVFHVGIYAGAGKAWHAPRPGRSVSKQSLWLAGGWQTSYLSYGRI